ncbi:MAG: hypothetical protein LUC43_05880 [Burkholderiales bacterium]|nr:hypothetical protein [Burkholderiales bacterium]
MLLSKQLESWQRAGKWDKIQKTIEKIKPEGRTPQMDLLLSSAYLQRPGVTKDKKTLSKVVRMLARNNPLKKVDPQWCLNMNMALASLHRFGESFPYLAKVMGMDKSFFPPEAQAQFRKNLETCLLLMRRPPFLQPFQIRVEKAWKEFEMQEASFRAKLDGARTEGEIEKIELDCEEVLGIALDGEPVGLSKNKDNKYQMVLKGSSKYLGLLEDQYFKEHCPTTLLDTWDIIVGQPPSLLEDAIVIDSNNDYENANIWVGEETFGVFPLDFFSQGTVIPKKRLPNKKEVDSVAKFAALSSVFLEDLLGEIAFIKCIRINRFFTKPLDKPSLSFRDMPGFLLKNGIDIHANAKDLLNKEIEYRRTPTIKNKRSIAREDIIYGKTICGKILKDFEDWNETEINKLEADGATAGYIYYGYDHIEDPKKEEKITEFRKFVKKSLMEKFSESELKIIGDAHGEQNDYIDIVLWNPNKVFESLRLLFETLPVPYSAFHVFRQTTDGIVLTGESTFAKLFEINVRQPADFMRDFEKRKSKP